MTRQPGLRWLALISILAAAPLSGQIVPARSLDYLFVTNVSDARALWVNPAGLAIIPEASLLAEFVLDRTDGDTRLSQWTGGLNSRAFAFSYQRNRFANDSANSVLRLGTALAFPRGAIGVAFSIYGVEGSNPRDADIGVVYGLAPGIDGGVVVRHIGRPTVDSVAVPLSITGGLQWTTGFFQASGETLAAERRDNRSGVDVTYRAGLRVVVPTRIPFALTTAVNLGTNLRIDLWHVGLSVGGRNQGTALLTAANRDDSVSLDRMSLSGVVSNVFLGR